ncbi:hypothetical protein SAMN05443270_1138 [Lacrimispora sphenoides]|jgi:hypothetical protein|uniref:hypothetical protein n=1 Tax=Lacrimispora sphenoides TaxID=29370 RepID=UPI0008C3A264|nr:hypothetical protein [Lacrimispora sphenoides]SET72512.1 hypothetical protein SAMN05443270_1138 [Lacrimispora sphenoides]
MPNYRRLISYIYAYEGAVKGKNIGFAKIETRGIQCKITVSVKRIYVGGNDIGVYLLAADQEIFLGNIFIRGGSGEFRTVVSASDIEHSGINMDQCYGLTIHDVKNTWRSYTTIWEDAVAHAAEVDLESATKVVLEKEQAVISEEQIKRAVREIEEEFPLKPDEPREISQAEILQDETIEASSNDRTVEEDVLVAEEQELPEEEDLQAEHLDEVDQRIIDADMDVAIPDDKEPVKAESKADEQEWIMSDEPIAEEDGLLYTEESEEDHSYIEESEKGLQYMEESEEDIQYTEESEEDLQYMEEPGVEPAKAGEPVAAGEPEWFASVESLQQEAWAKAEEPMQEPRKNAMQSTEQVSGDWKNDGQEDIPSEMQEKEDERQEAAKSVDAQEREAVFSEPYPFSAQDGIGETTCYRADAMIKESMGNQEARPKLGNPDELERLRQNEIQDDNTHHMIWEKLKREHTRILAFDYEDGCEILTIKPQDIGVLPRDSWVYGNNSFLLHGYYNYRYLILAKLLNPNGMPRYLLGIPGHYYSNERYMASMFGFPNFVLSKDQPMEDGRFGFWYTDVKLGG